MAAPTKDAMLESAEKLVECMTQFKRDDANFELCVNYVVSNFKYHRFLDVNPNQVDRSIEGIIDKFNIHCFEDKAKMLKELVTNFLESPAFEEQTKGKTDTHYGMLLMLLQLANAPIDAIYTQRQRPEEEKEEYFDWKAYLMEGEETFTNLDFESPIYSDEDEEETIHSLQQQVQLRSSSPAEAPEAMLHSLSAAMISDGSMEDSGMTVDVEDWLEKHVVVQYWQGKSDDRVSSTARSATLTQDWDSFLSEISSTHVPAQKSTVTEYHIIRETLWLLSGVEQTFVYEWTSDHYIPREDICLSHIQQDALHRMLAELAHYGTVVRRVMTFIEDMSQPNPSAPPPQTLQALGAALLSWLPSFREALMKIENRTKRQEEILTLSTLLRELSPWFHDLNHLDTVLCRGVDACRDVTSPVQRAATVLGVMYDMLVETDAMGTQGQRTVELLLPLWVKTCRPYLNMIDCWLEKGTLVDPQQEFIIHRNKEIKCTSDNFWSCGYTIHCGQNDESHSTSKSKSTHQVAPGFLLPVLEEVLMAGKSRDMLRELGTTPRAHKSSLYEDFLSSLAEFSKTSDTDSNDTADHPEPGPKSSSQGQLDDKKTLILFNENVKRQLNVKGVRDPLLQLNFDQLLCSLRNVRNGVGDSLTAHNDALDRQLLGSRLDPLRPLQLLLGECLYPHITDRYHATTAQLLSLLREKHDLLGRFMAVRRFFLMEASHAMYDFNNELFEKLRLQEDWQDITFLNTTLQEAVSLYFPDDALRLFLSLSTEVSAGRDRRPVCVLEGLTLHFQVQWPVSLVLSSGSLALYNSIFILLLHIKRVKYCLDNLRFADQEMENLPPPADEGPVIPGVEQTPTLPALIHRMRLFRVRLMHFVNSLHNYLLTRILHSTVLEFEASIDSARDLDDLIRIHNAFLSRLYERSLLHHKVALLKDVIFKVLSIALQFTVVWDAGPHNYRLSELVPLEEEFSRCITFLASFLNKAIQRGSFPHLESLAFALVVSAEVHSDDPTSGQTRR